MKKSDFIVPSFKTGDPASESYEVWISCTYMEGGKFVSVAGTRRVPLTSDCRELAEVRKQLEKEWNDNFLSFEKIASGDAFYIGILRKHQIFGPFIKELGL